MRGTAESVPARARITVGASASWLIAAALALSFLAVTSSAGAEIIGPDSVGSGSLDRPTGGLPQTGDALNRTKWKVQVGDSITGTIRNVTDPNLAGATEADVVIKS